MEHYNSQKTSCKRGHPFDEENTVVYNGSRHCKRCRHLRRMVYDIRDQAGRPGPKTLLQRFESYLSQDGDCWTWTGTTAYGYGRLSLTGSTNCLAHRWSYEYHRAEIPKGLHLDHLCRNTRCVNPWHLEPVTNEVNLQREWEAKRRAE